MTIADPVSSSALSFEPHFAFEDPYNTVNWEVREARIPDWKRGGDAFYAPAVEFPVTWSQNATNIVTQKYFRVNKGERETSLRQVFDRIADTIAEWGWEGGYFTTPEDKVNFCNDLKYLMLHQMMAFNSPVWFNIGVTGARQQSSACFILSVEDSMDSVLNWITEEGMIFKRGSGAGTNLSKLRSSSEQLTNGGVASGPVSFMRGADASAGTIKSGGATRRAAKMVILNVEHPDIEEFIWCKALEERKGRVLEDAGFDMGVDGKDGISLQYQNANNSVSVTDQFMVAVEKDGEWHLRDRHGEITRTVRARDLMRQIAEAAYECADPGVQYYDTINRWHCSPNSGPINGSNPCSEHVNLDNSSCNLASLNLLQFLNNDNTFRTEDFKAACRVTFVAQDILINGSDFPTEKIAEVTRQHRMLGLGYTNLGAALMCQGMPYDSDNGRLWAGVVTALMTGSALLASTEMAEQIAPYPAYAENRDANLAVLEMHLAAVEETAGDRVGLWPQAKELWQEVVQRAIYHGVRNNQATLLAPTGTISFALDADTTGIEPDFSLVKSKNLVGGGTMTIVNLAVPRALQNLHYSTDQSAEILDYISKTGGVVGAPHLRDEDQAVFACALGTPAIDYMGHVKMMAAVQPFLSAAISKTVNMPTDSTVDEIEQLYIDAWKMGVKCVAVYRDGSKVGQPLSVKTDTEVASNVDKVEPTIVSTPVRQPLERIRKSVTHSFEVGDCHGYLIVGEYADGRPGEIFLKVAKQGSTLAGIMDSFAISVSHALQYGVPLRALVSMYTNMKFEPFGMTDDRELRIATSIPDYIFRRLAVDYLPLSDRQELGVLTSTERIAAQGEPQLLEYPSTAEVIVGVVDEKPLDRPKVKRDMPICFGCGGQMAPSGTCYVCTSCGSTSGCS